MTWACAVLYLKEAGFALPLMVPNPLPDETECAGFSIVMLCPTGEVYNVSMEATWQETLETAAHRCADAQGVLLCAAAWPLASHGLFHLTRASNDAKVRGNDK